MTAELLDAVTEMLAEIFARNLDYTTYPPEREWYEAGVSRLLRVTEVLAPLYDDPTARAVEFVYLDRAGVERQHRLSGVSLEELMRDSGVRVPEHQLTWTVSRD